MGESLAEVGWEDAVSLADVTESDAEEEPELGKIGGIETDVGMIGMEIEIENEDAEVAESVGAELATVVGELDWLSGVDDGVEESDVGKMGGIDKVGRDDNVAESGAVVGVSTGVELATDVGELAESVVSVAAEVGVLESVTDALTEVGVADRSDATLETMEPIAEVIEPTTEVTPLSTDGKIPVSGSVGVALTESVGALEGVMLSVATLDESVGELEGVALSVADADELSVEEELAALALSVAPTEELVSEALSVELATDEGTVTLELPGSVGVAETESVPEADTGSVLDADAESVKDDGGGVAPGSRAVELAGTREVIPDVGPSTSPTPFKRPFTPSPSPPNNTSYFRQYMYGDGGRQMVKWALATRST